MKNRPTFLGGVAVAFVAAISAAVLLTALPMLLGMSIAFRLVIAGISFAYILYLLHRSQEPVGRVSVIAIWAALTSVAWLLNLPLLIYMGVQLGAIWLIRSLYFYTSPLSVLMDLGLNGITLVASAWVYLHTGSIFMTIWSFFLTQALFTAIPDRIGGVSHSSNDNNTHFDQAYQAAQTAIRKLTAVH